MPMSLDFFELLKRRVFKGKEEVPISEFKKRAGSLGLQGPEIKAVLKAPLLSWKKKLGVIRLTEQNK